MLMNNWIFVVFVISFSCVLEAAAEDVMDNPDTALLRDVLKGYDSRAISRVENQPLVVRVGFTLVQLHSLDEKKQMLTSSGWFQVEWVDNRLQWNATKYNRSSTVIPSRDLWLPDIGFLNSASIYHTSMIKDEFRCVVYKDGSVLWVPGGTYHTTCELDISKFPFDKQTCYLHLTNWAYNIAEMNLVTYSDSIVLDSYKRSAEWAITRTQVSRNEVVYECCGNVSYPSLHFHIWIERKSLYYIVNIITPCVILSMLATFTFCIPPDSGEKISLGITLLLSFTVFQLIVAESIPRRSDSIPIISLYISVVTGVVTSSIICTILISQIHHKGAVPIPYALRRFTFDFLASVVCLTQLKKTHGTDVHVPERHNKNVWSSKLRPSNSVTRLKLLNGALPACQRLLQKNNKNCDCKSYCECSSDDECDLKRQHSSESDKSSNTKVLTSIDTHLQQILEALSEYESRRIEADTNEHRIAEWKAVGKVYDRFFFIIFVVIMLIITVIFLLPPFQGFEDDGTSEIKVATGRPTPTNP